MLSKEEIKKLYNESNDMRAYTHHYAINRHLTDEQALEHKIVIAYAEYLFEKKVGMMYEVEYRVQLHL